MKKLFITILLLCVGSVHAALITNGSLTGSLANSVVPSGWSSLSGSPDTNNEINAAFSGNIYDTAAISSPDGGTWVGLAREGNSFVESFGQTVTGLNIGSQYALSWYDAHFGALGTYNQNNSIEAFINGSSIGVGALLSVGSEWFLESLIFTAVTESIDLSFKLASGSKAYLQIDGISLESAVSAVPIPAAAFLFAPALLGFMGLRRKAKSTVA